MGGKKFSLSKLSFNVKVKLGISGITEADWICPSGSYIRNYVEEILGWKKNISEKNSHQHKGRKWPGEVKMLENSRWCPVLKFCYIVFDYLKQKCKNLQ